MANNIPESQNSITQKNEALPKSTSSLSLRNFFASWTLIFLNIYLIDFVVRHRKIILTDEILLLVIFIGITVPITFIVCLFSTGMKRAKLLSLSALLAVATELIVIGSYTNISQSPLLSWLPSCLIAFLALALSITRSKKNKGA